MCIENRITNSTNSLPKRAHEDMLITLYVCMFACVGFTDMSLDRRQISYTCKGQEGGLS